MNKSKTILYVTRHGQTEWNFERRAQGHLNSDLTALGREQARRLGERLKTITLDVAYTSTVGRTQQTASIALATAGKDIPVYQRDDLREINFGSWEGQLWADIEAKEPERLSKLWSRPSEYQPDTGESIVQTVNRIKGAMQDIIAKHRGQTIFIVAHGGVVKALMYAYDHGVLDNFWSSEPYAAPTCLSRLVAEDDKIYFDMLPDISHLEGIHK